MTDEIIEEEVTLDEQPKEDAGEKKAAAKRNEKKKKKKIETQYEVSELVSNSQSILGVPRYVAAGAMNHAGIDMSSRITRKAFKDHCEAFMNAKAF